MIAMDRRIVLAWIQELPPQQDIMRGIVIGDKE
jgi:hypothetical protein